MKRLDRWGRKTKRWALGAWFATSNLLWMAHHPGRAALLLPVALFTLMLLDVTMGVALHRVAPLMRKS